MEEILKEILQEMKWQSKQHDKIVELLGKLRQPCGGQSQLAGLLKILESIPQNAKNSNPILAEMLNQMKDLIKENQP
jgi:hypothetical protein